MRNVVIPYGRQNIIQQDIDQVIETLTSDFLTQGPMVPRFESALKEICSAKEAIVVNSATSALHIAYLAAGLTSQDTLWTTPISFVATSNAALYCGALVDFVDVDQFGNMSMDDLELKLQVAKKTNQPLPKLVVPVHLGGYPVNMKKLHELSVEWGFKIIEDASHAIGSKYAHFPVGSCHYSLATIFSFHPVKVITTGEGGAITTNDTSFADKVKSLRSHGITRELDKMKGSYHGGWYYQQVDLGFNYRMTELQAALGLSQLSRLQSFVNERNRIAQQYSTELSSLPLDLPQINTEHFSAFHLYIIRLSGKDITSERLKLYEYLKAKGLGVNVHYIPIHSQPYYKNLGFSPELCPKAMDFYSRIISIPIFPDMTQADRKYVVETIREYFS